MTGRILSFGPLLAGRADPPAARPGASRRPAAAPKADETPLGPQEAERFRQLFLPHLDGAYSFARYLCRDATQAEDLAQDAFVRAFRGFRGFRGGDPRAWLFAIVRSSFHTWVRGRATWTPAPADALERTPSDDDTPETALLRQDEAHSVRAAIEDLPEPFREALVLRELEELSYRDIAEITGAPIGTVMSRLARARQMLLAALGPLEGAP